MSDSDRAANAPDDWDQHWEDFGDPADGNPANRYRQRLIIKLLGSVPTGARLLDIGSGQGELALLLAGQHPDAEIWGIEYSWEGVRRATEAAARGRLGARFTQRDLLRPAPFDARQAGWATHAVCSEVLEHVDQPEVLLGNARHYLASTARLVVTVPGGPRSAFDRHIGHRRHFTSASLRQVLENAGYRVDQVLRAGFPFFDLYRLSVIARGRRLVRDVAAAGTGSRPSAGMRVALRGFDAAFHLNADSSPFGWQLVAVARPAGTGPC